MSFTRDVVTAVSDITLSSDMPDYPTILNLDRRMREHPLPEKYDPLRFLYGVLERTSLNTLDDPREMQSQNETSSITLKSFHLTHFRALGFPFSLAVDYVEANFTILSGNVHTPGILCTSPVTISI